MKKILLLTICMVTMAAAMAQRITGPSAKNNYDSLWNYNIFNPAGGFYLPPVTSTIPSQSGALRYNSITGTVQYYKAGVWRSLGDSSGSANFANTDLIFTGNRHHNAKGYSLTVDSLSGVVFNVPWNDSEFTQLGGGIGNAMALYYKKRLPSSSDNKQLNYFTSTGSINFFLTDNAGTRIFNKMYADSFGNHIQASSNYNASLEVYDFNADHASIGLTNKTVKLGAQTAGSADSLAAFAHDTLIKLPASAITSNLLVKRGIQHDGSYIVLGGAIDSIVFSQQAVGSYIYYRKDGTISQLSNQTILRGYNFLSSVNNPNSSTTDTSIMLPQAVVGQNFVLSKTTPDTFGINNSSRNGTVMGVLTIRPNMPFVNNYLRSQFIGSNGGINNYHSGSAGGVLSLLRFDNLDSARGIYANDTTTNTYDSSAYIGVKSLVTLPNRGYTKWISLFGGTVPQYQGGYTYSTHINDTVIGYWMPPIADYYKTLHPYAAWFQGTNDTTRIDGLPVFTNLQYQTGTGSLLYKQANGLITKDSALSFTAKNYSYPFPYSVFQVAGTSIEASIGATSRQYGHAYLLSNFLQIPIINNAAPGAQAADQFDSIALTPIGNNQLQLMGSLSNDPTQYGANADKQANFQLFDLADITWMLIPDIYKVKAQSSAVSTTGTWSNSSFWGGGIGKQSSVNGSTLTATVTGTSIYVWYTELDGNLGTATVTVDGGSPVTINCFGQNNSLIQTINNSNKGEALLRISGLSNTLHTVVITVTSSTGASNVVYVDAVSSNASTNTNTLIHDQIAYRFPQAGFSAYNPLIAANLTALAADGFKVVSAQIENTLVQPTDFAADLSHPNNLGHSKLFDVEKNIIDSLGNINTTPAYTSATVLSLPSATYATGLGSQLITNTGWTSTGWTGDSSAFVHTAGNTNVLFYNPGLVAGKAYQLTFGVTAVTAGTVTVAMGGVTVGTYNSSSIVTFSPAVTSNAVLTFTPTSNFDGTVTRISVNQITTALPPYNVVFSDTTKVWEQRISKGASYGSGIGAGAHFAQGGNENIALGSYSQFNTTSGSANVSAGLNSLWSNTIGQFQLALSAYAGYKANGIGNLFIGPYSGYNQLTSDVTTGNYNVLLGYGTGVNSATANGQLSIQNILFGINNTNISGGISTGNLGVGVKSPAQKFEINGGLLISSARVAGQGVGLIADYNNGISRLLSIDYPNVLYKQMDYNALFHTFSTKGIEYLRLDSTGNFLYKTTTPTITGANFNSNVYVSGQGSFGTTTQAQALNANAALFNGTRANSGIGLIADYNGTTSRILSYNYTGASYLPLDLNASFTTFSVAGAERFRVGTGGLWSLNGTAGTALQIPQVNSGGTAMQWASATGWILNQTTQQSPGNYNILGNGTITNSFTNTTTGGQASNHTNAFVWASPTTPASGSLYASDFNTGSNFFSTNVTIPNSAVFTSSFNRASLLTGASSTVTLTAGSGGQPRAISAAATQVYLPSATGGITTTADFVAGINILPVYQDAGTTNSVKATNYAALLIAQTDENLQYAAITNKYGIYQVGTADTNVLKGYLQLPNLASAAGTALVLDASNNVKLLTSSRRFKENITPLQQAQRLYQAQGVNYNYKSDATKQLTAGIIAEQLDSLGFKDVVIYDKQGQPFSIQYNALVPYLLELLKAQKADIDKIKQTLNIQ